jgi:hypothetical protein
LICKIIAAIHTNGLKAQKLLRILDLAIRVLERLDKEITAILKIQKIKNCI